MRKKMPRTGHGASAAQEDLGVITKRGQVSPVLPQCLVAQLEIK